MSKASRSRSIVESLQRILLGTVLVVLAVLALVVAVGELSGEVVVLHTRDESQQWRFTRLWLVEHDGDLWLRAGGRATQSPDSWFARLTLDPRVKLERGGMLEEFNAIPVPEAQEIINQKMNQSYPLADWMIRGMRSALAPELKDTSKPIRLERSS